MHRAVAVFALALSLLIAGTSIAHAQPMLEWDASTGSNITGYIVSYGTKSGAPSYSVNVGNTTRWSLAGLQPGVIYYLTVRAYDATGMFSVPSAEISYQAPMSTAVIKPTTLLFWQHARSGALAAWHIEGTQERAGGPLTPDTVVSTNWKIVATGDFNRDGAQDLVWQHTDGTIATWLMRGTTRLDGRLFEPGTIIDPDWRITAAGDMNGDGACDLIWRHRVTGALAVWYMDGTRQLMGKLMSPGIVSDRDWEIVGAADFNGDSHTDLLWRHKTQGWLSVWLMNGIVMREGRSLTPNGTSDTGWSVRAVGDLNGDGKPDLIWQHTDGRIATWLMNGLKATAGLPFTPGQLLDVDWTIVGAI
jgi:hypothetical protein